MDNGGYGVEEIIGRRIRDGKVSYLIKWENYPPSENSWEPAENLNDCDELIANLDTQRVRRIIGARQTQDDRVEYLVEFKDEWPNRVISAADAIQKCPNLLLEFLESHIKMYGEKKRVSFATVNERLDLIGEPIRATYVTKVTGDINYWFEWPQNHGHFVTSEGSQILKIRLLEQHLIQGEANDISSLLTNTSERHIKKTFADRVIGVQMLTRRSAAQLNQAQFQDVQVKIKRNIPYDAYLLKSQLAKSLRRRTLTTAIRPKSILVRSRSMGKLTVPAVPSPVPGPSSTAVAGQSLQTESQQNNEGSVESDDDDDVEEEDARDGANTALPIQSTSSSHVSMDEETAVADNVQGEPLQTESQQNNEGSVESDDDVEEEDARDGANTALPIKSTSSSHVSMDEETAVADNVQGEPLQTESQQTPNSNILRRYSYSPSIPQSLPKPVKLFASKNMIQN